MSSIEKAIERLAKSKVANADSVAGRAATQADEGSKGSSGAVGDSKDLSSDKTQASKSIPGSSSLGRMEKVSGSVKKSPNNKLTLDYRVLSDLGYAVPESENKQLLEEYRIIKRPVVMNAFGKGAAPIPHGNLVSIASSLPAEGKSFTAMNLGLSIASEMDATVLLIDGDVIKASLTKLLGAENKRGLIDLLEDPNCAVGDVILDTQNPKLKIIPAGTSSTKSTELLASQAMERLLTELAERYSDRIILFDSPPILATSEARVLNHLMGQVLLVVEAGQTPVGAVKDSLSRLDADKAIGLVLNKSRSSKVGSYFGTYY
ncbi:MAG: XrtA-associated tyrosine autokinase [Candidatus Thiodiazotropha sp. (ex Notomyrtea botanica)]|nr:XrtA-associated tyrosine autokinase [Candidatus Thiodiazotropha sp. (ex Notomyrtea botanica)]